MVYLHNSSPPVVHRDLKSPNLLIDEHWRVKVGWCRLLLVDVGFGLQTNWGWLLQALLQEPCQLLDMGGAALARTRCLHDLFGKNA